MSEHLKSHWGEDNIIALQEACASYIARADAAEQRAESLEKRVATLEAELTRDVPVIAAALAWVNLKPPDRRLATWSDPRTQQMPVPEGIALANLVRCLNIYEGPLAAQARAALDREGEPR